MTSPNWALGAGGNNALSMFQFGAQLGQQAVQRRDQREHQNALLQIQQGELAERRATREATAAERAVELEQEQAEAGRKAIGNAAYDIIQTAPEQRAAKWDAYVQRFGMPELVGQYSDQRLNEVVAQAGLQKDFQQFQQPDYEPIGENGLAGFQFGQPIQQGGHAQNFGNAPPPPAGFQLDQSPAVGGPTPPASATFRP